MSILKRINGLILLRPELLVRFYVYSLLNIIKNESHEIELGSRRGGLLKVGNFAARLRRLFFQTYTKKTY
jgi:hypothetical protein